MVVEYGFAVVMVVVGCLEVVSFSKQFVVVLVELVVVESLAKPRFGFDERYHKMERHFE